MALFTVPVGLARSSTTGYERASMNRHCAAVPRVPPARFTQPTCTRKLAIHPIVRAAVISSVRQSAMRTDAEGSIILVDAFRKLSLLLADVDGTLVTRDKVLTERALKAVHSLHDKGIRFAITSGRPPKGMAMLIAPLAIDTPVAEFNGGLFVHPDLSIIEEKLLPFDAARQTIDLIDGHGLDSWVYAGNDWLIRDLKAPHVEREVPHRSVRTQSSEVRSTTTCCREPSRLSG